MNLDNKFGECCNCPGFYNGDRIFTNYQSSRLYNDDIRKKLGIIDSHSYRMRLQNNGFDILKSEYSLCKSNSNNKFNIDYSKFIHLY